MRGCMDGCTWSMLLFVRALVRVHIMHISNYIHKHNTYIHTRTFTIPHKRRKPTLHNQEPRAKKKNSNKYNSNAFVLSAMG